MPASYTRLSVHEGIASYFGGTYSSRFRGWQGGQLNPYGLGTVRLAYEKEVNDADYFAGEAGSETGGVLVVYLSDEAELRRGIGGKPVNDGSRNIITAGIKDVEYRVTLDLYTISQCQFVYDAQVNFDTMLEQVKQQVRLDPTLGGICDQAGEGRFGLRAHQDKPFLDENTRVFINGWVQFQIMTQISA